MKKLLLLPALALVTAGYGQTVDSALINKLANTRENMKDIRSYMYDAGYELRKYSTNHTVGIVMEFMGGGIIAIGSATKTESTKPFIYAGAGISIAGFILAEVVAPEKLRNAGIILTNAGISIPLHKKNK